jgi:FMN phosphatase YigB (HAD superfamily)
MIKALIFDWGHTIINELEKVDIPVRDREVIMMPGLRGVLPKISIKMGIWANTRSSKVSDLKSWLTRAGIDKYFTWIITSADLGVRKPDYKYYKMALDECGLLKDEILFVGNQLNSDIKGANEFGIKNVWLSDPFFRSPDDSERVGNILPTYQIKSFTELPGLINLINKE